MRIREKKLIDYGIGEARRNELMDLAARNENRSLLEKAAFLSNPYLAPYMVSSLVSDKTADGKLKLGSRRLFGLKYYPPCKDDDFYAYRRKTIAIFNVLIMKRNRE